MRISDWSSDVCSSDLLDHITSSGLGLDDTSMFEANSFATSQLIRRRQAASSAFSEATNECVFAFIGQSTGCATPHPLPVDTSCSEPPAPIPTSQGQIGRAACRTHLC